MDEGFEDAVTGALYDTGRDYPAARFVGDGTIRGRTFGLREESIDRCLDRLDHEEGTVAGLYRRVTVTTLAGVTAWAYEYGDGLDLTPIPSGDWFARTV